MRRSLTTLVLCFQLTSLGVAQQPSQLPAPPPPTPTQQIKPVDQKQTADSSLDVVKVTTNLVQIDVVVTDRSGRKVTDLRADEVEILEDGKPRTITNFSYLSIEPKPNETRSRSRDDALAITGPASRIKPEQAQRVIAMVVDDLSLAFVSVYYVRRALKQFVDEQMQPNDLVAIIRAGAGIGALQQFTNDKRILYAAIDRVKWNGNSRTMVGSFSPFSDAARIDGPNNEMKGGRGQSPEQFRSEVSTVGTLGAISYVVKGLKDLPGRKSVILFSDGFALPSERDPFGKPLATSALRRLIELANRASVVVYSIYAAGLQTLYLEAKDAPDGPFAGALNKLLVQRESDYFGAIAGLLRLADETGGIAYTRHNYLADAVKRSVADQSDYYLIGYRPDDEIFNKENGRVKFHSVSLKVKRPGKYEVRMRKGFLGLPDEETTEASAVLSKQEQMTKALVSPFGAAGIQLRLTSLFVNDPKVGAAMHSFLQVNATDIDFTEEPDGSRKAVVDFLAVAFGDNGQVVDQFSVKQTIRVKQENVARVMRNGFTYNLTIPIKRPGAYQFRTVLRDDSSGRVGSASQFIEVPDLQKNQLQLSGIVMKGMAVSEYLKGSDSDDGNMDDVRGENEPNASVAVRQFKNGMALAYGLKIYNAEIDKRAMRPNLKVQVRVFRNGELLFAGEQLPYDATGQADLKRLTVNGGLQLAANLTPGDYVLQMIVYDYAKDKPRVATQQLDFEIVK